MATSESSIATTNKLDIDSLMSKDFDLEEYVGADTANKLNLTSPYIDKNETIADIKMSEFLKDIGVSTKDGISAHTTAMKAVLEEPTSSGLWGSISEGWNNGKLQTQIADIRLAELRNQISPEIAQQQVESLKAGIVEGKSKGFGSWFKSAANLAPMALESTSAGAKYALTGGLIGGGVALAGGQAGPQVALPEEVVTVPAGFILGADIGAAYGTVKRATELETGLMYDELLTMTDANGNKIDPSIAKPIAATVGVINGLLELTQIKDIISTIPGGKKLIAKAQRNTIKNLVKSKSITKMLAKNTASFAGHVAFETGVEVVQEADNIILGEFAKQVSNQLDKTNLPAAKKEEITKRLVDTAIESAKGFSLIAMPGTVMHVMGETASESQLAKEDVTKPVERITKILSVTKIKPRIDVSKMGQMGPEIREERVKPPKEVKVKEAVLSPEEEYQLQQTEATLKAAEPFKISPRLYIGNVTQRMKKVFADIWNVETDEIGGFTEGAFPTKRAKIEMTMDEARGLLVVMENSLNDRLNKSQIVTYNDMARANADWGDIKALRKALGLPETKRPFTIERRFQKKVLTIENIKERIEKAVTPSKLYEELMTKVEKLNLVMRTKEVAIKKGYTLGQQETRKLYAEIQYLKKQKELREKLLSKIAQEPPDSIDFFYREAIGEIQKALDLEAATPQAAKDKFALKKLLDEHPEKADEIPANLLETLSKKSAIDLSYNDLLAINNEIKRLSQLGRLKSKLYKQQRGEALKSFANEVVSDIQSAAKNIMPSMERANTLRPTRIFDMLDGGKKFAGKLFNFFYRQTNEDYNAELSNSDARISAGKDRLNALGLRWHDLVKKRIVGDFKMSVDEMLSVYAGWKNPESQAALRYGGIPKKVKGKEVYVEVTDEIYNQIEAALSESEKAWGDTIIQEYSEHYDRMRNTVIRAENRDPGNAVNYTKIRRKDVFHNTTEEEMLDELALRHFFRQAGVHKGFAIDRKNIPPEYQKPIELGLTKIWTEEIRKQEHYINNAQHIKEMRAIYNKPEFQKNVKDRFGAPVLDTVDHFINSIANPDFYKTFNDIEQISKLLRRHTAIAYIAFNLSSYMNQLTSITTYWAHSSVADVLKATATAVFHPMQSFQSAENIHYQISHQAIEREMMEIQRIDENAYKKIVNTVGRAGMYGIFAIDRATRVVGINAVYNYNLRKGLSPSEAAQKASMVTLLTQESASPKDLAKLYSSNEVLNWFTMFTNQLNQIYNISTYDIPAAWRNKNYLEAARSAIALSTMAAMIWMIQNGELPDEPEEIGQALGEQAVSSLPLVGSYIVAGAKGWSPSAPAPLKAAAKTGRAIKLTIEGDYDEAVMQLAEPLSIGVGFPYQGTKDIISIIDELD